MKEIAQNSIIPFLFAVGTSIHAKKSLIELSPLLVYKERISELIWKDTSCLFDHWDLFKQKKNLFVSIMFLVHFVVRTFFICTPILSGMTKLREAFPRESTTRGIGIWHSLCCSHTRKLLTFLSFSMLFEPAKLLRPVDKNLIPDHIIEMSFNTCNAALADEN